VQHTADFGSALTYQLYIRLLRGMSVRVGALGPVSLAPGWYVYTGSARRGLVARVRRHLARGKRRRWHVDWITTCDDAAVYWVALSGAGRMPPESIDRGREGDPGLWCERLPPELRQPSSLYRDALSGCRTGFSGSPASLGPFYDIGETGAANER